MVTFRKKNSCTEAAAAVHGRIIRIEDVNDPTFAQKMIGDGIAVIPDRGIVTAPFDGTIILVAETLHAFGIRSRDGLEVLVHIGIDTVKRRGEGFHSSVKAGSEVKRGDTVIEFDYKRFLEEQVDMTTMMILTNANEYDIKGMKREGAADEEPVFLFQKRKV